MVSQSKRPESQHQGTSQTTRSLTGLKAGVDETIEEGERQVETRIDSMVHSLREAVELFEDEDQEMLARVGEMTAQQLNSLSQYVRTRHFNGIRDDAAELARSHALLFLGASLAGGFLLGRFARSSSRHMDGHQLPTGSMDKRLNMGRSGGSEIQNADYIDQRGFEEPSGTRAGSPPPRTFAPTVEGP
jgi:hypothetical protein